MVAYGATAYGRRTGSLKPQPFPWSEVGAFAEGWSVEDRIRAWSVFGGIPYYLKEIDPASSLAEAIRRAVLYPDGLLRDEPRFLLSQESRLRDVDTYMSCLRAIAAGVTRLNEIAQRIGKRRSEEARPFLETLEEMGLVERRYPVTQPSGKRCQLRDRRPVPALLVSLRRPPREPPAQPCRRRSLPCRGGSPAARQVRLRGRLRADLSGLAAEGDRERCTGGALVGLYSQARRGEAAQPPL